MTLQIMPPELVSSDQATSSETKRFDRQEFTASSLADGQSETFRITGTNTTGQIEYLYRWPTETEVQGELKFSGFAYSREFPGAHPPNAARKVDWSQASRPKLDGEFTPSKRALLVVAFSHERQREELLILEQRSLKDGLLEIVGDPDYTWTEDGVAEFQIKISRKGTGLSTSYSIMPKPSKPNKVELNAFNEVKDTAQVAKLLDGGHPFLESIASFTSTKVDSDTEF